MKRYLSILLASLILVSSTMMTTFATQTQIASGTCGENLTWTLTEDGTMTISGEGAMEDYGWSGKPWDSYDIKKIVIENGVTSIGSGAFSYCFDLTSVEIPNSVTTIGWEAFRSCSGLTDIELPDSVTIIAHDTFLWCTSLANITIPASVTRIDDSAFDRCSSLTTVCFNGTEKQ